MGKLINIITNASVAVAVAMPSAARAIEVARFPMEISNGKITESISGATFDIQGKHSPENIPGAEGNALRFDGYSTYIDAAVGNILPAGSKQMTASVWLAIETYPIVEIDVNTAEQVAVVSCLDETAKTGFGFFVGFDGKYSFKTYVGGWPLELKADGPLKLREWINLAAVVDTETRSATLYNNGVVVATSKANGGITVANSKMRIGRSFNERFSGPFCTTSFNGLIDDIAIWNEALDEKDIQAWTADNVADLSIPSSRFAGDPMRPAFHGMPGANWTNETHGMTFADGRYHLFFQKNANGPYMARLHWGHLSSKNLYDWREEPVALTPGSYFDIKGCWSGCVFSDEQLTQGKPSIIYTGVDYAKAVIAQAMPADDGLTSWDKASMPIINGRPDGLSDDFRDPYFFRTDNGAYIIVGSSKGGIGTTTLHEYNPATGRWSNDGRLFFTGDNAATCGTFWEMPNVTRLGDKWLFTATPQKTSKGVAALYWVGTIGSDGTFTPDKMTPSTVELPGFARDGYGLLSPTVYQYGGKTIALGIVPDKLPSQVNADLGYAHLYSLPREWSLDAEGNLCQKPYSGLSAMRCGDGFVKSGFSLDGTMNIDGISGRAVELAGEFTVNAGKCGFTVLDDGATSIKVYFDGSTNEIVVDARGLDRFINDSGVFDGCYRSQLPKRIAQGETIKLNVFFDHSVLDIFVNDTWASSVRVFAKAKNVENATVFADAPCHMKSVRGWILDVNATGTAIGHISDGAGDMTIKAESGVIKYTGCNIPATMSVYDISGNKVLENCIDTPSGTVDTRLKGFHIVSVDSGKTSVAKKILF